MGLTMSPAILSTLEQGFIQKVVASLATVQATVSHLFYFFVAFEIVFFGLGWALGRGDDLANLLKKVLKISFFIFLLEYYPQLATYFMQGFSYLGLEVANAHILKLIAEPALLWQYGFDYCIHLFKFAAQVGTANGAAVFFYESLGFGSLLLFALLAAQVIYVVTTVYVIALTTLITLPLSVFQPTKNLLPHAMQHLFKAGVRVITLMLVLSVAAGLWGSVQLGHQMSTTLPSSLTVPLGFFFSTLVLVILSYRLPERASEAIGCFDGALFAKASPRHETQVTTATANVGAGDVIVNSKGEVAGEANQASVNAVSSATSQLQGNGAATQEGSAIASGQRQAPDLTSGAAGGQIKTELSQRSFNKLKQALSDMVKRNSKKGGE